MSLNKRLLNASSSAIVISSDLVIGCSNGYSYNPTNGFVEIDSSYSPTYANVAYHPIVGKHYAYMNLGSAYPQSQQIKLYESSDNGGTWSNISLTGIDSDRRGGAFYYDPQDERLYFGGNYTVSTAYVTWINNQGVLKYNRVSVPNNFSYNSLRGTDYDYIYWHLGTTGPDQGGTYFADKSIFDGAGGTKSLGSRLLAGTGSGNRVSSLAIDWSSGNLKIRQDYEFEEHYYSTNGVVNASNTYNPGITGYTVYEGNGLFFGRINTTGMYYSTSANGTFSSVHTTSNNMTNVVYDPSGGVYYFVEYNGDLYASTDGTNWSLSLNIGTTETPYYVSNFV
jgi:hypothetical protein